MVSMIERLERYKFIFPGSPIAQQRPRLSKYGVFNPQSEIKKKHQCILSSQIPLGVDLRPLQGSIKVEMGFYTKIPNSWSQKRKESVLGIPDITRPDLDNYVKFYLDVMNQIIYNDDSQVTLLLCKKNYSDKPRTVIEISKHEVSNGC